MNHLVTNPIKLGISSPTNGIDPFRLPNVIRSTKNELIGNFDSWYSVRKSLRIPVRCVKNSRLFFEPLKRPVFIIGAPRSGTTFLGKCLSPLPSFSYFHEPASTKCAVAHVWLNRRRWPSLGRYYRFQYRLLLANMHKTGQTQQGVRLAEKTPRNCFIPDFLYRTFPDAKFIHIIRDGADSAYSNAQKHWLDSSLDGRNIKEHAGYLLGSTAQFWTEPHRRHEFENASKLKRSAWTWRRYTESAIQKLRFIPDSQQKTIRYELLAADPISIGKKLSEFLGLNENESNIFQAELEKVSSASIGNAKRNLTPEQFQEVKDECGELRCQLNYQ